MKKIILPALCFCLLILGACSDSNLDKLHGKWRMDIDEAMKDQDEFSQSIARVLFGKSAVVEIDAKGKQISLTWGTQQEKDAFTVVSDSGTSVILKVANSGRNRRFDFKDQDTIMMRGSLTLKVTNSGRHMQFEFKEEDTKFIIMRRQK